MLMVMEMFMNVWRRISDVDDDGDDDVDECMEEGK